MVVLFVLLFLLQMRLPKKFEWNATYYHADRQPFGCYVFDSVLTESMPKGYQVTSKTFRQLDHEHPSEKIGVLMVVDEQNLKKLDVKHLCNIARRGGKVMVVTRESDDQSKDTIYYNELEHTFRLQFIPAYYFSYFRIYNRATGNEAEYKDTINWKGKPQVYPAHDYVVWDGLSGGHLDFDSLQTNSSLAFEADTMLVAASVPYGKGEVIFVTSPLLFTNYGMLEGNTSEYIFRLMSMMADVPVYRTETYMKTDATMDVNYSPFRELIKRPPLRWALYLLMLGVVLLMVTTARRRQRVIPIIAPPLNKSLEFVRLIGTLYYQRCTHAELVRKKFTFFAEELRRRCGIDVRDVNTDDGEVRFLAEKTGLGKAYIQQTLREIRLIIHSEEDIKPSKMREMIEAMSHILEKV